MMDDVLRCEGCRKVGGIRMTDDDVWVCMDCFEAAIEDKFVPAWSNKRFPCEVCGGAMTGSGTLAGRNVCNKCREQWAKEVP